MAEQVSGIGDINYGMGTGWLDYYNLMSQMLTQQGAAQGSVGTSVLDQLTKLITNPTSGPLGLAATAAYGNPQGIAAATDGAGFDNSQYQSQYDKLLNDLLGYTGNINKTAADIPLAPDPNTAPAMTPTEAAKAPNQANDWLEAWKAYNPGKTPPAAGLKEGGKVGGKDAPTKPHPIDKMVEKTSAISKAAKGLSDYFHADDPVDETPGYEDGGLVKLKGAADTLAPDKVEEFWRTMQNIGKVQDVLAGASDNTKADVVKGVGGGPDVATSLFQPSLTTPDGPTPSFKHIEQLPPAIIQMLIAALKPNEITADPNDSILQFQDGGVTLAGQPHSIVDANGQPVARITEDGAPEHVAGTPDGGVEVTPLRPDRFKAYTGEDAGSDLWARMLARLEVGDGVPGAATGQNFLFPDYPGGKVDTNPGPGTNQIPTFGGPSVPIDRGPSYGAGQKPKTLPNLMEMTANAPGANNNERFARLLGGAFANNTTMGDPAKALNAGKAPTNLLSSQQLSTLSPSQRASYTALLQQMGIVQSPEDLAHYVKQFTPDGLG